MNKQEKVQKKRKEVIYERFAKTSLQSAAEVSEVLKGFKIRSWAPEEASTLYGLLEHPNWAPWLEASIASLAGRATIFPKGQLVMVDGNGHYAASLSLNQIDWDGDMHHLPTWDEVAGDPTDYSKTYIPNGNTLVLLSMNVAPEYKRLQLPTKMIEAAAKTAQALGVSHLIGSFRPSGFGEIKKGMGHDFDFETYCLMKQHGTQKPVDPWLRSLWWNGMEMLTVDPKAMTVSVSLQTFEEYRKTYKPDIWEQVKPGIWECAEVGSWVVDASSGTATYQESNMWGRLPLK